MIMPPDYYPVYETEQKALIIYEEGKEELVVSISFNGNASEFGWVIPLPNQPEVSKVDSSIFRELVDFTKPKENLLEKIKGDGTYYPMYDTALYSVGYGKQAEDSTVEVIEEKSIGIYDYAVLKAEKVEDLKDWMNKNNYKLPVSSQQPSYYPIQDNNDNNQDQAWSDALPVFQDYIDSDWYFVTVKVNNKFEDSSGVKTQLEQGTVDPLRFSFQTTDMIYPMKLTALAERNVSVMLYVIDDHVVKVKNYDYENASDSSYFKTSYAGKIKKEELEEITKEVGKGNWYTPSEDMFISKLYASNLQYTLMKEEVLFEDTESNQGVNDGSMTIGEWFQLPFVLVIYFPYLLLGGFFEIFDSSYYYSGSGEIAIVWLVLVLGILFISSFGWVGVSTLILKKTLKKSKRLILYTFQFPAVWFLSLVFALGFAILFGIIIALLTQQELVVFLDAFCCLTFLTALFPVLFYRKLWGKKGRVAKVKND